MLKARLLPGQVGLMLLVVMGLVMGLVLSIASRSLTDTVLSRQERENTTAFSLAESGVEEALRSLAQGEFETTDWQNVEGAPALFEARYAVDKLSSFEMTLVEGKGVEIDTTTLPGGASLLVEWTRTGSPIEDLSSCSSEGSGLTAAGMVVTILTASGTADRTYLDPYSCDLAANGFAEASGGGSGYRSRTTVTKSGGEVALRLTPIYNTATVRVTGAGLTEAMIRVAAVATGGDAQKEIEVKRSKDAAGSVFDYAIFSGGSVIHN